VVKFCSMSKIHNDLKRVERRKHELEKEGHEESQTRRKRAFHREGKIKALEPRHAQDWRSGKLDQPRTSTSYLTTGLEDANAEREGNVGERGRV